MLALSSITAITNATLEHAAIREVLTYPGSWNLEQATQEFSQTHTEGLHSILHPTTTDNIQFHFIISPSWPLSIASCELIVKDPSSNKPLHIFTGPKINSALIQLLDQLRYQNKEKSNGKSPIDSSQTLAFPARPRFAIKLSAQEQNEITSILAAFGHSETGKVLLWRLSDHDPKGDFTLTSDQYHFLMHVLPTLIGVTRSLGEPFLPQRSAAARKLIRSLPARARIVLRTE